MAAERREERDEKKHTFFEKDKISLSGSALTLDADAVLHIKTHPAVGGST